MRERHGPGKGPREGASNLDSRGALELMRLREQRHAAAECQAARRRALGRLALSHSARRRTVR